MNILIIGFGDIGKEVGARLGKEGHRVTALRRADTGYHDSIQADISKPLSCRKDFDYVLYILTPSSRDEEGYKAVFDVGLQNALAYFSQSIFMFISSSVVYGENEGAWVDEETPTSQDSMRSRILSQAEERVLATHDKNVVLRLSGIYGRGNNYLLEKLQRGEGIQQIPPYYTNRIHKEDCVGAIVFIMIKQIEGSVKERIFNVTDSSPLAMYEVATLLAQKEGLGEVKKAEGTSQNKRISNQRLLDLGYTFVYPSYVG